MMLDKKYYIVIFSLLNLFSLRAVVEVKVGLAHFPAFVVVDERNNFSGIAVDMIEVMNQFQDEYRFVIYKTTPERRHLDFRIGAYDVSLFDDIRWGWHEFDVEASRVYLMGGELYIARAKPGRDQSFFSNFEEKKMVGILGYHYQFAGFNSDPAYLKQNYSMVLYQNPESIVRRVIAGKGDVAVITKSYLDYFLKQNSFYKRMLLISDTYDQIYSHTFIVRKNIKITAEDINELLDEMEAEGVLEPLWEKYGIVSTDMKGVKVNKKDWSPPVPPAQRSR